MMENKGMNVFAQDVEADEDDDRMQVEGEAQPSQQQVAFLRGNVRMLLFDYQKSVFM